MEIVELFRRLAYGELSNLSINQGDGKLNPDKHPQMIQYVNEALLDLYSRFVLRERNLILELNEHVLNYHLSRQFAVSSDSGDVRHRYIVDCSEQPFEDDVIRILSVWDEKGNKLVLNDVNDPCSLFTPRPHTLQVNNPKDGVKLAIIYQARHPKIDDKSDQAINEKIDIPFSLETAVQTFIAHKTYSHMNGQENTIKGQEYLAAYEATCLGVEQRDLVNQSFHTSHHKLEQRGFV